jgi:Mrp family chromosome partitioning ATPase
VQIVPELPSPLIPIAVALGVGLLLAVAVPLVMDRLDHTIRDARAAGEALAAPVLSTIPPVSLSGLAPPGTRRDAAYRALAATSVATDQLPRAIVVTSPLGVVQDSVAANFAAALAGLGLNVALLATDARQSWFMDATDREAKPEEVQELGTPTLPDLLTLARRGQLNGQIRESLVPSRLANLAVLPPGAADSDALLDGLPALLEALAAADVDVTVIAGPSLLEDPAATIFAWSTRSVLWVVEAGEITEQDAREAASRLALAGATPFGVALVEAKG